MPILFLYSAGRERYLDHEQREGYPGGDAQGREHVRAHHDLWPSPHFVKLQRRGAKGM